MNYKVIYCKDCRKYEVVQGEKTLKCKLCGSSTKMYKKTGVNKKTRVILVHQTAFFEVAKGLVIDLEKQKGGYSEAVFSSYNFRRDSDV